MLGALRTWLAAVIPILILTISAQGQEQPEGFQQILKRGGIPAIDDPQYVSANEAELEDSSFVLGVVMEDQPLAFSLNLLNRHEIVNDTIGSINFAAVW